MHNMDSDFLEICLIYAWAMLVGLPMVQRFVFGDQVHQLAIATGYIWVLEKDDIGAPLRKILIYWGIQNKNTMSFTLPNSHFRIRSVMWKLSKLPGSSAVC